ncbi:hypothetical protein BROC_01067 [Candidatus Brocadiaceae bacterium]|nr:hypothetical protein BROC_01067 [Candidatus Brocadiaceae bacterium]
MSLDFIRPEFLTPFMFGFGTPFLLKLWNKWQKGCILTIFLLWVYFVWFGYIALMLRSYPASHTSAFFVGFAIAFSWTFLKSSFAIFEYLTDKIQDIRYFIADRRRARQWRQTYQEQSTGYEQDRAWRQKQAEAERARREAEARNFRDQQNKSKQQNNQRPNDQDEKPHKQRTRSEQKGYQNQQKQERIKDEYQPESPEDNRTYEQILGLSAGWTQADLKEAHRRESQRTHTDKWVGKPRHIQQAMEEEFKLIQEAYKKLKK